MAMDAGTFAVLAEPTRLRILDELRRRERSVNELVERLDLPQPAVSKHLKVLRDGGFVSCRTAAQQRIYSIDPAPLRSLDAWLDSYRRLWSRHLDALERHLDRKEKK
jgi:DNA-binding transcriptional ArsR family regulator